MFGIIIGIAFFFLGAMITSSFPSSEENLTPYRMSSFIKILGLGILIMTLLIGGIIGDDLNKHVKLTILIIGLVMLLVFTVAAQFMKWDISTAQTDSWLTGSSGTPSESSSAFESRPATPGFELLFVVIAIIAVGIYRKIKPLK